MRSTTFCEYRNWVIINLLLNSGCRAATIRSFLVKDVNLNNATITYRHTKNKSIQIVPLCSEMVSVRCGRRKISLSVFCCYSLESAFRRVFTAAGMPLYGAALYDLDWRFSSENAFRVGKAVRLCIENKTVAERITRAEAAQLLHAVQTQTLTATSFDTLVAVENLMQWNVNTFLLELQKILQFNTMK